MTFRTDSGGLALACNDLKISAGATTWATKLSQLGQMSGKVRIITYSLPDMAYVRAQLGRRPKDIQLICHDKFRKRAVAISREYRGIEVATRSDIHAKVLLIAPQTVWICSDNFGSSKWLECGVGLHSKEAHDHLATVFENVWEGALHFHQGVIEV